VANDCDGGEGLLVEQLLKPPVFRFPVYRNNCPALGSDQNAGTSALELGRQLKKWFSA
jgi:hypothetical protein